MTYKKEVEFNCHDTVENIPGIIVSEQIIDPSPVSPFQVKDKGYMIMVQSDAFEEVGYNFGDVIFVAEKYIIRNEE